MLQDLAELISSAAALAWPIVALVAFLSLRRHLVSLFSKPNLTVRVAGFEFSVAQAAEQIGKQVADLQERVSRIEAGKIFEYDQGEKLDGQHSRDHSRKILWVDDSPSNNAFLIEKFRDMGIDVQVAQSTKDAMNYFRSRDFGIVITDLGRKEGGEDNPFAGIDLIKSIRAAGSKIPILVFSGKSGLDNKENLVREGANAVTSSGVEVIRFVEDALNSRR